MPAPTVQLTPFSLAQRFIGTQELGDGDNPLIQWWLSLCGFPSDVKDEVPWCSAFLNGVCWLLRAPRSKSAAARSWLAVGQAIDWRDVTPGWDVVVLKRGTGNQPGPEVLNAPGHVGLYAGDGNILAGNQGNQVSVAPYRNGDVLGYRRLSLS